MWRTLVALVLLGSVPSCGSQPDDSLADSVSTTQSALGHALTLAEIDQGSVIMVESSPGSRVVCEFHSLDDSTLVIIRTDVMNRIPVSDVLTVWIWIDASRGTGGWESIYIAPETEPGQG